MNTGSRRYGTWSASTEQQFLTRNLEWSLHVCVLHDMFNDKFTVRREFLADEVGLRRRFIMAGLVQLALMPFLLVFMVMQFFLQVCSYCCCQWMGFPFGMTHVCLTVFLSIVVQLCDVKCSW